MIVKKISEFPVFLAPLTGITDLPFRSVVANFGAGLVFSEMVASKEIIQGTRESKLKSYIDKLSDNTAVQLVGTEVDMMTEAARMLAANGVKMIDINMGCPARKVVNKFSGSALMRDLSHALRIIEAVISAVDVPVSLKCRLGWDSYSLNALELAKKAQEAGIALITIHARTRCQFFQGKADWKAVAKIKKSVQIPIFINGDITSEESAILALKTSDADGIMVGRGAKGRPWLLADLGSKVFGKKRDPQPRKSNFVNMVVNHYEEILSFYGKKKGIRMARKHLVWYMDLASTPKNLKKLIITAETDRKVMQNLPEALSRI